MHTDHQRLLPSFTCVLNPCRGICLLRTRVVPWITSRHLSIDHPGTYWYASFGTISIRRPVSNGSEGYADAVRGLTGHCG